LDECAEPHVVGAKTNVRDKNRLSQKKDKPGERCKAAQKDKPVASVETKKSTIRRNGNEL
jgi:hypothetical protein